MDDEALLIERGRYATLTRERDRMIESMTQLCGAIMSAVASVQGRSQKHDCDWSAINEMMEGARTNIARLPAMIDALQAVVEQRNALRAVAWPKSS